MFAERIGSAELAELAAGGGSLTGTVRAAELPRLADVVARESGHADAPLAVTVDFAKGPEGFPVVRIRADGALRLTCQRCLGAMSWPVALDVALTAVASEARADELADPFDSVLLDEDGALALRAAVEDEVLATLPLAPLHEDGTCGGAEPAAEPPGRATVTRPFAGLDTLLKRGAGGDAED
jgi:uncharacterized protein